MNSYRVDCRIDEGTLRATSDEEEKLKVTWPIRKNGKRKKKGHPVSDKVRVLVCSSLTLTTES